jgi:sugar lactone lactonase YvrE
LIEVCQTAIVITGNDVTETRWDSDDRTPLSMEQGWDQQVVIAPSLVFGANGIRVTPAGELWITQSLGDRITSFDPASGRFTIVSGSRDGMSGPDDLAFDSRGACYLSQPRDGQASVRQPSGNLSVLLDNAPEANGITVTPDDRLFVDECRSGGRLLEVSTDGSFVPRTVISGIGMANALEMGPDGRLYLPEIETGRILAVDPDSGHTAVALDDVAVPSAVKFDPTGRLVLTEAATGHLVATDLASGGRQVLAALDPGLDNLAFDGHGAVYISNFVDGSVTVVDLARGTKRVIHPAGLLGPCSLASGRGESVVVADWMSVAEIAPDGTLHRVAQVPIEFVFSVIGAVNLAGALIVLTSEGKLFRRHPGTSSFEPLALGDDPISALCATASGAFVAGGQRILRLSTDGRVVDGLDSGLGEITSIAAYGTAVAASDALDGRVMVVDGADQQSWTGFDDPCGVAITEHWVYVAERAARRVLRVDRRSGRRSTIATSMPFGSPAPGHRLRIGSPSLLAQGDDRLLVGCDGDGSVRRLHAV